MLPAVQCISHCSTRCSEVCQVISYKERSRTQATQGCKAIFSLDTQGHGIKKRGTRERQFSLKMQGTVLLYQANRNKLTRWQTSSVLLKCACKCVSVYAGGWYYIAPYIFMASRNRHHWLKKTHFLKMFYSFGTINTTTQFCRQLWVKELRGIRMVCCPVNYSSFLPHYQFLTKTYTQDDFSGLITLCGPTKLE